MPAPINSGSGGSSQSAVIRGGTLRGLPIAPPAPQIVVGATTPATGVGHLWVKHASTWKEPTLWVKHASTWKEPTAAYVKTGGTWQQIYPSAVTGDPTLVLDLDFTTGTLDSKVTFARSTTATYINSSGLVAAAAIDAPRFDYDPSTLAARGLLIEEQRTNYVLYSGDISNAAWATFQTGTGTVSIAGNSTTAPDGTTTAALITINRADPIDWAEFYQSVSGMGATSTISIYFKAFDAGEVGKQLQIAPHNGSAFVSPALVTLTAGWTRHTLTVTGLDGSDQILIGYIPFGSGGNFGTGQIKLYAWGAQGEIGSCATSYIPTTSAAVTRAADNANIPPAGFTYPLNPGTYVLEGQGARPNGAMMIGALTNAGVTIVQRELAAKALTMLGSFEQPRIDITTPAGFSFDTHVYKIGHSHDNSVGSHFTANGLTPTYTYAAGINPDSYGGMTLGSATLTSQYLNGTIKRLRFYNVKKSAAELQALTEPDAPAFDTVTKVGSTVQLVPTNTNANTGTAGTVTVPSDATFVTVVMVGYNSTPGYYSGGVMSITQGGSQVNLTSAGSGADTLNRFQCAIFYGPLTETGAGKSIQYDWTGAGVSSDAVRNYSVQFWKGVDTASPVRDSDGAHLGAAPTGLNTPTLTAQSGDLIFAAYGGYVGASNGSGAVTAWSNLTSLEEPTHRDYAEISLATGAPTGDTAVGVATATGYGEGGIIAIVIKPAPL